MSDVDIAPGSSAMFAATDPDPVVKVQSGPATIFVIQGGRVLATIEWPQVAGGTCTVPLKAVAASSKPLFVGVMPGLIPKAQSDSLAKLMCPHCRWKGPNGFVPCCP